MHFLLPFVTAVVFLSSLLTENATGLEVIQHPIHSKKRYELMKLYAKQHYGLDHANLINPKMIVTHYTALSSLRLSFHAFEPDEIPKHREKLSPYGKVNVGVHYLVDLDGTIYELMPTTLMGRHVVGYNHTAIGIENVASSEEQLTDEQIRANAKIIQHLLKKHPSIEYLVPHMNYMNQTTEHFKLFREYDEEYEPPIKIDPGFTFTRRLNFHLKRDYNIILKD